VPVDLSTSGDCTLAAVTIMWSGRRPGLHRDGCEQLSNS
jgi:hypothetical protein